MNLLLYCEIVPGLSLPDFGEAFFAHIEAKKHPDVRAASLSAWNLLAHALQKCGYKDLPEVRFEDRGKPYFADAPLHFSLSHSGKIAAALISDAPCALDVQQMQANVALRLENRCLSDREKRQGCDFFECWVKKECIGKLSGIGLPSRPSEIDTLLPRYDGKFHLEKLFGDYLVCALCTNECPPHIKKEEL